MKNKLGSFFSSIETELDKPDLLHTVYKGKVVAITSAAQSLGKLGGLSTKKKYGKAHYQKLAKHMNEVKKLKSHDLLEQGEG